MAVATATALTAMAVTGAVQGAMQYQANRKTRKAQKALAREQAGLIAEEKKVAMTKRKSLIKSQRAQVGGGGGYSTKRTGSTGLIDSEQLG